MENKCPKCGEFTYYCEDSTIEQDGDTLGQTIGVDVALADSAGSIQKDLFLTLHGLKQRKRTN